MIKPRAARFTGARDVYKILSPLAKGLEREHVWRIDLDARQYMTSIELIGMGTVDQAVIAPREVFRGACRGNACGVVIGHNHPTGNPRPSDLDVSLTKRLVMCGLILGIALLDHVIITESGYFSLRDHKLL